MDARQELPELELEVLERWRERDVFGESLRSREGAEQWVFYEGPPTANGRPGSHHVLSRVFKDIYPRYKTMRGYRVERKGGWDCHGLPVEIAVEQKLGITSKAEIEDPEHGIGIERFNEECRNSVFEYLEEWDRLTERIGFWVDLEHAYRTLDESYIESVWWALTEIERQGAAVRGAQGGALLLPLRHGAVLARGGAWATRTWSIRRCMCACRSHQPGRSSLQEGDALLIWTTTPWTLPGNVAVAVGPDVEYVRAAVGGETLVLAEALVERVLGEDAEVLERFRGRTSHGKARWQWTGPTYEGPIFNTDRSRGRPPDRRGGFRHDRGRHRPRAHRAGVRRGRLHAAAATGCSIREPGNAVQSRKLDGTYDERVRSHDGYTRTGFVKDPALTEELIADLDARGLLFRRSDYEHSYPHCWRCGTPLIYYAKPSWYIATSKLRDRMMAANETIDWYPPHIKHGRFGDWLVEQRGLGALARALLGHAAAGVALRGGPHTHDRLLRRA